MKATRKDAEADEFDLLYASAAVGILRQMVMLTGDAAEAEDVTAEAFERAWLNWSTVRRCRSPEAWVRTVARRIAVSRWRRMRNSSTAWLTPRIAAESTSGRRGSCRSDHRPPVTSTGAAGGDRFVPLRGPTGGASGRRNGCECGCSQATACSWARIDGDVAGRRLRRRRCQRSTSDGS